MGIKTLFLLSCPAFQRLNLDETVREGFSKKVIFGPRREEWEQSIRGGEIRAFQVKGPANAKVRSQEITHYEE